MGMRSSVYLRRKPGIRENVDNESACNESPAVTEITLAFQGSSCSKLSHLLIVFLEWLYRMDMGDVTDVSKVRTASSFMVKKLD
jgi:hypothetical protein